MNQVKLCSFLLMFWFCLPLQAGWLSSQHTAEEIQEKLARLPDQGREKSKAALRSALGDVLYDQGRMLEAADQYEKALTYPTSNSKRRHIYLYLGKSYESSQRLEKSVEAYELAVLYDKKNWKRHRDLAGLYERVRLFKKAEHAYTKAIQLFPSEVTLYFSLGRTYRKMGLYSQAEQNLKRSLDLGYQMHLVNFELSRVFEGQGRFGAAAEACQRSLSPAPTPEEAGRFVYLSVLADRPALVDESLKELRAVEKNKESLAFYENMVELLRGSPLQVLQLKTPDPTLQRIIASLSLNN